ncbi:MAG TPA: hypothetical protein V6D19_20605 [Stenomitos sp.]
MNSISAKCSSSVLLVLSLVLSSFPTKLLAQVKPPLESTSWTEYVGSQNIKNSWSGNVRSGYVGGLKDFLLQSDVIYGVGLDKRFTQQGPDNHWDSAREPQVMIDLLSSVENDDAANLKSRMLYKVKNYSVWQNSKHKIWWQLGNEINSAYTLNSIRAWEQCKTVPSSSKYNCSKVAPASAGFIKPSCTNATSTNNDPCTIPYYVEYYLAPAIEAIQQQEAQCGCQFPIVLGTVGTGYNPDSRAWLNRLLNYQIKSTQYAPSLTGKYVYQLVNVISTHYLATNQKFFRVGNKRVYQPNGWKNALDDLYDTWVGKGAIQGIWATEDVGVRATSEKKGSKLAVQVMGRYFHYWTARQMRPSQGKFSFYDWYTPGTFTSPGPLTANETMTTLFKFLGDTPLKELSDPILDTVPDTAEAYSFQSVDSPNKRVFMLYNANSDDPASQTAFQNLIRNFSIRNFGWSNATVQIHLFSPIGHRIITPTLQTVSGGFNIQLPSVNLSDDPSVLITVQEAPARTLNRRNSSIKPKLIKLKRTKKLLPTGKH